MTSCEFGMRAEVGSGAEQGETCPFCSGHKGGLGHGLLCQGLEERFLILSVHVEVASMNLTPILHVRDGICAFAHSTCLC